MLTILSITSPIFILIAIGFAAVRSGVMPRAEMRALGIFVINFALPALLFKAMALRPPGQLVDVTLLLVYALGSLAVMGLVIAYSCLVEKRSVKEGAIIALGTSISNTAFIGFPIAQQMIGPAASAMLALYVVVENLVILPWLLMLAELDGGGGQHWLPVLRGVFGRLLKNPMILAILAGVVFSVLQLPLPVPALRAVEMLSAASAPVALFYIGCILANLGGRGMVGDIGRIAFGKLILHPLAVFTVFLLIPFADPVLKQAAIINAGMPMFSIYPLLVQKYGKEGISAAALVATTVVSFFTISTLIWLTAPG